MFIFYYYFQVNIFLKKRKLKKTNLFRLWLLGPRQQRKTALLSSRYTHRSRDDGAGILHTMGCVLHISTFLFYPENQLSVHDEWEEQNSILQQLCVEYHILRVLRTKWVYDDAGVAADVDYMPYNTTERSKQQWSSLLLCKLRSSAVYRELTPNLAYRRGHRQRIGPAL